jgi:hypothetical protein
VHLSSSPSLLFHALLVHTTRFVEPARPRAPKVYDPEPAASLGNPFDLCGSESVLCSPAPCRVRYTRRVSVYLELERPLAYPLSERSFSHKAGQRLLHEKLVRGSCNGAEAFANSSAEPNNVRFQVLMESSASRLLQAPRAPSKRADLRGDVRPPGLAANGRLRAPLRVSRNSTAK